MSSVKLVHLPDTQLLRLQAMRNTCTRMDSLVITYFDRDEIDLTSANMARFDINEALKKIDSLEKIFLRVRKNFGQPEKFSEEEKNGEQPSE